MVDRLGPQRRDSRDATLTDANTAQPTFNATIDGTYVLSLVASSGAGAERAASADAGRRQRARPGAFRHPLRRRQVDPAGGDACTSCHSATGSLPRPPVFFTNADRNGDGSVGDATDDAWFYAEVRGRINFTEIAASPLLRKAAGDHHSGGPRQASTPAPLPGNPTARSTTCS